MNSPDLLQLIFAGVLIGTLTAYIAKGRGRDPVKWFFVGMLCGVFGLIALFFFPPVKEEGDKAKNANANPNAKSRDIEVTPVPVKEIPAVLPWYYLDQEHKTLGPITEESLLALVKEEKITPRTYMWQQGKEGWKRLQDLPELQILLQK